MKKSSNALQTEGLIEKEIANLTTITAIAQDPPPAPSSESTQVVRTRREVLRLIPNHMEVHALQDMKVCYLTGHSRPRVSSERRTKCQHGNHLI